MSRSLIKQTITSLLCLSLIAATAFIFPASAAETVPSFPAEDIYYNNYLDFYNGIDISTGENISDSLLLIKGFDTYIQNQSYTCADVASMMVENYYTGCGLNEDKVSSLENAMNSNADFGTGTEAVKAYFDSLGWYTLVNYGKTGDYDTYDPSNEYLTWPIDCYELNENGEWYYSPYEPLKFLRDNVAAGMPTIVECIDWGGHWLVVVGYDDMGTSDFNSKDDIRDDVIIMADPGDKTDHNWNGYYIFPAARFLYEWYDDYCLINHNDAWSRWNYDLYSTTYLWHPFVLTCPPVLAETEKPLKEKELNNTIIHLSLMGVAFEDEELERNQFSLDNAPAGLSISSVQYIDSSHADLVLAYTGKDFDADQNMFVLVSGMELDSGKDATSNVLSISSKIESHNSGANSNPAAEAQKEPSSPEPKVAEKNGIKTSSVELNSDFIQAKLSGNAKEIAVAVKNGSDIVTGQINGELLKDMADKNTNLRLETETAQYLLPVNQLDLKGICSQFGSGVSLIDIDFEISISKPDQSIVHMIKNSSESGGFSIVVSPVQFEISCTYQGKEITVDNFNGYVDRYIAITDGVDPDQVTAAVVLQADGTLRPVPMKVVKILGKNYAKISSLTNSTYALISNKADFGDTVGHWAEEAIRDLSSRLIVNGAGQNSFKPNKAITRAEFAAIIVKALGIEPRGSAAFTDVKSSDWFKDYVDAACSKGLISGYADGSFKPNQNITREEAMVILLRAIDIAGIDTKLSAEQVSDQLSAFSDSSSISPWAQVAVASCVRESIATGKNGSLLAPKVNITRAEICIMVQRALKKSDLI